ncbi:MAG: TonB-dependent receptor, partial [Gemmatimonadaceae bacterium]
MRPTARLPLYAALAALITLVTSFAGAQGTGTISGKVSDQQTGAPVSGARVGIVGSMLGTTSRADGSYRFSVPAGRHELRATAIGYSLARRTVNVAAGAVQNEDIALERSTVQLQAVTVTGTRTPERTVVDVPVPVDVLGEVELKSTGRTETAQILQFLAPSFNFPRTSIADGTDHTRPATLRGLAPDQVLVLVNGKRRHASALINVNGTVGRGSGMVDINAIPASAIERVEILRDGAAAQYGSDAIAGVLNIVLKANAANEVTTQFGATSEGDGEAFQGALNYALPVAGAGFLQLSGEFRSRQPTNRSGLDARQQYFAGDPRNNASPRRTSWQGDGEMLDGVLFANAGWSLGSTTELYAFGGFGARRGEAWGFFRRPNDNRTVRAIHPDGFLPMIQSDVLDGSAVAGLRSSLAGWRTDVSANYGRNSFGFTVKNSNNVTLGTQSPTEFDAGTLYFDQQSVNFDAARGVGALAAGPVNVAVGAEIRRDHYRIEEGERDSYRDGGVRILDGPSAGQLAAVGAQVFPGFRPSDSVSEDRYNLAGYLDVEAPLSSAFLLGVAVRAEDYSDFGSQLTGKVAARLELSKAVALRGAVSNGFRAPSLGQSWFSSTATNFIGGVPFENRTFPVSSDVAKALGAQDLKAETSINLSGGVALRPVNGLSLTLDYYRITIDDRIILSGNFTQQAVRDFLTQRGFTGVSGARFFTNAVDTRTQGFDAVFGYTAQLQANSVLRLTGGYNTTDTKVTRVSPTPGILAQFQQTLFDSVELVRVEDGQPQDNLNLMAALDLDNWSFMTRSQRYGEFTVRDPGTNRALDQTFASKWVADVSAAYRFARRLRLMVGVDNIFDEYPDPWSTPITPSPTV